MYQKKMTKIPKHGTKSKGEDVETLKAEKEKIELEATAQRVQKVLEEDGFGLQTYLQTSEFGIVPRVRLAKLEETNEEPGETKKT